MMDTYSIYPKQFNNAGYKVQSDSCFVIMPFSGDLDNTYMVIESVANNMKIKCVRADNISTTSEPILNKICVQISQAYYIIVDITNLNPNVFYELGIAHVLRDANKVLIIKEAQTECPSDIRHLHYYEYSKSDLKSLKSIIERFFSENNILEDLQDILNFLGLLPKDNTLSQNYVVSLSDCLGSDMDSLITILNNRVPELSQNQIENLLILLTSNINKVHMPDELSTLYLELILFLISKVCYAFDISDYLSQIFSKTYGSISDEWIAECSIVVLESSMYFDKAVSWIMEYLKGVSPAAFDVAKYKIEIGIIKSKSEFIDTILLKELKAQNKTLAEHCAKLIKERKTYTAIPVLLELVEYEENPYVVRSSLDALVKMAPLNTLLCAQRALGKRKSFVDANDFLKVHLHDLETQISKLQHGSDN